MMCDDIADLLATLGHGTVATDIFTHSKPPTPDRCLSVHQFALDPPVMVMSGRMAAEWLGLQIQVREATSQAAEDLAYVIFNALNGDTDRTIGAVKYLGITAMKSPALLKIDGTRSVYYVEFRVAKA